VQAVDGSLDRGAVRSAAKAAIDDGATTLGFLATGFCRSAREVDEFLDFIVDLKG
jgi:hypothetical protein